MTGNLSLTHVRISLTEISPIPSWNVYACFSFRRRDTRGTRRYRGARNLLLPGREARKVLGIPKEESAREGDDARTVGKQGDGVAEATAEAWLALLQARGKT